MTHDAKALLGKALALPDSERGELAGNLIASLDTAVDPDADAACKKKWLGACKASARAR